MKMPLAQMAGTQKRVHRKSKYREKIIEMLIKTARKQFEQSFFLKSMRKNSSDSLDKPRIGK